jgi:tyrosine decarboxylase/aspartate 1-decarboxylase
MHYTKLLISFFSLYLGTVMEEKGKSYEKILELLKKASDKDHHFKDGKVLGPMYTEPVKIAQEAHSMFIEANLGNPGLYPGSLELEKELIDMLAILLHGEGLSGLAVSGGTEANITALWIAKKITSKTEVIFPRSAHFSFHKAVDILNLEAREVGLNEKLQIDISEVEKNLSKNTAAVVGIAGTTEFGVIDPIEELGELCSDTFLHVDAAFGGFVIPFLKDLGYEMSPFDFEVENIDTLSVDPHKMGLSTIPSGVLLMREIEKLQKIAVSSPYLTSPRHASLSGTRCSAGSVSAWAVMKHMGREGYRSIVSECMQTTGYLVKRVKEIGLEVAMEPIMNIVCTKMKSPEKVQAELDNMGWKASVTREPRCLRIVVMPHVTNKVVDEFMPHLEQACKKSGEL